MTTRISGVFVPQVLTAQIAAEMDTRTSNLIRSGAVVVDPFLAAAAGQNKGSKVTIPQYDAYKVSDEVGNDDPTDSLTTNARTSHEVDVPMLRRVVNFSAMDLARAEANADPLGDVAVQAAQQIIANQNAIVIASLEGVLESNKTAVSSATGANSMRVAVTAATSGSPAKANRISRAAIIDAVAHWGDYGNRAAALVMHSAVYYALLKDDTTSFAREGEQGFVNTYMGIPVILDDSSTIDGSNALKLYTTYVLGAGAIGFASLQGSPVLDRNERVGNGWGQETLIIRRTDLINPRGVDFSGTVNNAGNSDTTTGLDKTASWSRVWNRKNIPITFITSQV